MSRPALPALPADPQPDEADMQPGAEPDVFVPDSPTTAAIRAACLADRARLLEGAPPKLPDHLSPPGRALEEEEWRREHAELEAWRQANPVDPNDFSGDFPPPGTPVREWFAILDAREEQTRQQQQQQRDQREQRQQARR